MIIMKNVKSKKRNTLPLNPTWKDLLDQLQDRLEEKGKKRRRYIIPIPLMLYRLALAILGLIGLFSLVLIVLWNFFGANFVEVLTILKVLVIAALFPVLTLTIRGIIIAVQNNKHKKKE